jgi:hypothetical protein
MHACLKRLTDRISRMHRGEKPRSSKKKASVVCACMPSSLVSPVSGAELEERSLLESSELVVVWSSMFLRARSRGSRLVGKRPAVGRG